ncbi:MAG: helix-turn-helix transcriptional regulator [Armatimonadota bacterium]
MKFKLQVMKRQRLEGLLASVARNISNRRKALDITQEELADRAGLSTNYVARLEVAMNAPSLPALSRLAEALQVDVGALVTMGRTFTHTDRVEAVAREFERLTEKEEELLTEQIRCMVDLIVSLREDTAE